MQLPVLPVPAPEVQPLAADAPRARLTELQERWVKVALGELPPAETRTTCDACVKIPPKEQPRWQPLAPKQFHPDTKCCTYLPVLHNFQVGALLGDPRTSPAGLASLQRRIDEGVGVTPAGLLGNADYFSRYTNEAFGRDPSLLCPHYLGAEGGKCGVWFHRNATCSTWFCCCDRGLQSFAFWRKGLMPLLRAAEEAVSDWCVFALGGHGDDWGPWRDQREFYKAAARVGYAMEWERVLTLGGGSLQTLADQARHLYGELAEAPPDAEWEKNPTAPV